MANFPEKINDYKIYVNKKPELRGIGDLQLPSFDSLTESVNAAGILGEIEIPIFGQFSSMKFVINWTMITDEITTFLETGNLTVDARIANQEHDTTQGESKFIPQRVFVRGKATKNDFGKVAKGQGYEGSTEIEVTYIKIERNGVTMVELDKLNYIYKVNGEDQLKGLRAALGMS